MIAIEGIRDKPADRSFGIVTAWATPDNTWVKMAWTSLKQPMVLVTRSQSKHVIALSVTIWMAICPRSRT